MKTVLDGIERRRRQFAELPFFHRLDAAPPGEVEALRFLRNAAHFVMAFADLNTFVFREEPTADEWQLLVNQHTYQDDHHWEWYLSDLRALGLDDEMRFTDALRFVWHADNRATRLLSYKLWSLAERASGLERFVIIEAIEATGQVLFDRLLALGAGLRPEQLHGRLIYVAHDHVSVERGHVGGRSEADARASEVCLDATSRVTCMELADRVFVSFSEWVDELHRRSRECGLW